MFGHEYGHKLKRTKSKKDDFSFVKTVSPIVWSEHCNECGAPLCYSTCIKYRRRRDGRCQLFSGGISKIPGYGLIGYSASIHFEGWAKLEALFRPYQINKKQIKLIEKKCDFAFLAFTIISLIFDSRRKIKKYLGYGCEYKEIIADKYNSKSNLNPDALYINITNPSDKATMVVETRNNKRVNHFKKSYTIESGKNEITIPFEELMMPRDAEGYISITLNKECTLIFHALDCVTFTEEYKKRFNHHNITKTNKIKCVAWDLDNTLWDGVLIEGNVFLNHNFVNIMHELDNRGIINSIVSKNNKEDAIKKLNDYGLIDLIVMPQINWNPKSFNISTLAKQMNIGIDTICFIDDNPFELSEVSATHPEVLCINAADANNILSLDCFNVPISEESKKRRLTYKMKEKEQVELEKWEGNIYDFLKTCDIKVVIDKPKENEIDRCYELIQRTNQLNSSGRRLSIDEIKEYINSKNHACFVIRCSDKFGDYGIVGFSIFNKIESIITDFVISCRVANKTIEQSFIQTIYSKYCSGRKLYMHYRKTNKNGPLFSVLTDLNMTLVSSDIDLETYSYNGNKKNYDIVSITI